MAAIDVLIGFLPGLAWLFFYMREDTHPEPARMVIATFLMGGLFAFIAFFAEVALHVKLRAMGIGTFSSIGLVSLALIEELAKFFAAFIIIRKSPVFKYPIDAMIYIMIAALGFATVENIGAIVMGGSGSVAIFSSAVQTASFRFVGATLLHSLTSSIVGYHWARAVERFGQYGFLLAGIAIATLLHAVFNYIILHYGNLTYTLVFLVCIGFFALADFEKLKSEIV